MNITNWTEFSRKGGEYVAALKRGESFLIVHNSKPIAVVRPISPNDVTISVNDRE